jgi:exosortase C (VPDSG-CTERM-specific)
MNGPAPLTKPSPDKSSSGVTYKSPNLLWRSFALKTAILALCFIVPLFELIRFAATSDLYSYILLIPFISVYLIRLKWQTLPGNSEPATMLGGIFMAAGLVSVVAYWIFRPRLLGAPGNYLAVTTICFLLFFFGVCCLSFGKQLLRALAFPLGFLIFITPIPEAAIFKIDSFLQAGSAIIASVFFQITGTPFLRSGLGFQLPDISIEIAPECSGIHSTLVLFITSFVAAYFFLRTPWKRALLILLVIPLGILRNGFRVFVIGQLCIHIGPQMINSYIHRKGGPIFFALSLIPLFLLLLVLRKSDERGKKTDSKTTSTHHA